MTLSSVGFANVNENFALCHKPFTIIRTSINKYFTDGRTMLLYRKIREVRNFVL